MIRDRFSPLVLALWGMVLLNLFAAHLAFGGYAPSSGGDAAGNAMSGAFEKLFKIAAVSLVAILTLLFLFIRHQGFRVTVIVLLALNGLLLLTILSLQLR